MIVNVMIKPNLLVRLIRIGEGRSVYQENGCAMVTQIVWMVLMKIRRCITVLHLSLVGKISSLVPMVDALIR